MYGVNINIGCHYLELMANIGACIPVYGTHIIIGRFLGGAAQAIVGIFLRVLGACGEFLSDKELQKKKWREISEIGAEHTMHGFLNMGVAISQLVIGFFTFNVGNVVVHYCFKGSFNFEPFVPYKGILAPNSYAKNYLMIGRSKNDLMSKPVS